MGEGDGYSVKGDVLWLDSGGSLIQGTRVFQLEEQNVSTRRQDDCEYGS